MKPPVLIELNLIMTAEQVIDPRLLPALAELNQADRALVLLAERPDLWKPTRSRVDHAFKQQQDIEARINRGGGMLDAILYLDFSLFSRLRQRKAALSDLAARYDCDLNQLAAIAVSGGRMAETLTQCQISLHTTDQEHNLQQRIAQLYLPRP